MFNVIQIIKELENISSTNDKIAILKANSDNELFKNILKYTYTDSLMYGFSDKKLRQLLADYKRNGIQTWDNGFDMLDELSISNINDTLRNKVLEFLSNQAEDTKEIWIRVITKDLRIGANVKLINKAIPKLIKTWEVQQGYPIHKYKFKKNEWIALSLKLNGIRSSYFNGEFRSRQNKVMHGFEHIKKELELLHLSDGMFVDGEMIRINNDNISDNENFRLTTSIVNSDTDTKIEIGYVIFDLLPSSEFIHGESSETFKERLNKLNQLRDKIEELNLKYISVAPTFYTGTDHSMIDKLLDKVDTDGYEGLMCLRDVTYKCKRHNGILKCKKFLSSDCEIVGYEEGSGRLKGMLGSFIINYKGNNVKVGSGYSDEQRATYWSNRDTYIGKILEVKYKEESKDKNTGLISLQFPTFVCIREDKGKISYE